MQFNRGISVTLDLLDGTHRGIRIAGVTGWSGNALAGPRSKLKDLLNQKSAGRTGVYILAGRDKATGALCVYIGKSRSVAKRIRHHQTEAAKEFWAEAYLFTNKGRSFNEALAGYVESELVARVRQAGRVQINNNNIPDKPDLARAAVNQAEHFLSNLTVALPVLGLDILERKPWPTEVPKQLPPPPPRNVWIFQDARAKMVGQQFKILAGSKVRKWFGKGASGYGDLQKKLSEDGALHWINGEYGEMTRDVEFNSSSAAAAVVSGRSASGPVSWVNELSGETLGEALK